ncbi:MAG TPA: trypsin-like peptidase domain-containing protein [Rubrivivax sp.]|nr:trypsin-like peptidase domain-containing protein [Rubrivivax sp.]HPO18544.1 trypsin-like peptidase domain-containing protein [Rubrivivax sp.]
MLRKLWLLFAQTVTIGLGLWFVVAALRPEARLPAPPPASAPAAAPAAAPGPAPTTAPGNPASYSQAARRAAPAVVSIVASKPSRARAADADPWLRHFFGNAPGTRQQAVGLGSGVIVSADGLLLTNNHVVEGASDIEVQLADGRQARAQLVGTDPETDLALLKITLQPLPVIALGDMRALQVGDVVLAIGNPFNVGQTVTSGIVSALGRNRLGLSTFENFIQTDAAINPGNSGGALVDAEGRLIGINTAIYSRSGGSLGIGFAIPVDAASAVMAALLREGRVTRGWIGVEPRDLTSELAASLRLPITQGVLITGVLHDGPASRGGMRPGDVVLAIDGAEVGDTAQLLAAVSALKPRAVAEVKVQRGNQPLSLKLTVAQRPAPQRRGAE